MASTYHQLGTTAQNRGLLEEADGWTTLISARSGTSG